MDLLNDSIPLAHFLDTGGKDQRDDRGKSLRDYRYGKRDGDHQRLHDLRFINKDLEHEHQDAQDHACNAQDHGDTVQILLQRGLLLGDLMQHAGNLPDFRAVTDLFHDTFASAVFDQGGHERLVFAVSERCLFIAPFTAVLFHRKALPCQSRFIQLQ